MSNDFAQIAQQAIQVNTILVDRFVIQTTAETVKFIFAEQRGTEAVGIRAVIAMSREDAKTLQGLLTTMLMESPNEKTVN